MLWPGNLLKKLQKPDGDNYLSCFNTDNPNYKLYLKTKEVCWEKKYFLIKGQRMLHADDACIVALCLLKKSRAHPRIEKIYTA